MGAPFIMPEPVLLPAHVLRRRLRRVIADARHLLEVLEEEEGINPDPLEDHETVDEDGTDLDYGEGDLFEDAEDADPDEDDGTAEPMLGAPERHPSCLSWSVRETGPSASQVRWADGGRRDFEQEVTDEPHDDVGEAEPSLGSLDQRIDQTSWAAGCDDDREHEDADFEDDEREGPDDNGIGDLDGFVEQWSGRGVFPAGEHVV